MGESTHDLRSLLEQQGSYGIIAAGAASGQLSCFPIRLFAHIEDVYRRIETAGGDRFAGIASLKLAALVHEEPLASLHACSRQLACAISLLRSQR